MSGPSLFSMEWWLTVVVLSVALNLVATYLKSPLDRAGASVSTRWARRNAKRAKEREKRIEWAGRSDMNYITRRFQAVTERLHGLVDMLIALFCMLISQSDVPHAVGVTATVFGLLALVLGVTRMNRGFDKDKEADEAFDRRMDGREDDTPTVA